MFYLIKTNPIFKKILLFILAVCAASCGKVLADRASNLWGPKTKNTEAALQAVIDMREKLPIKLDEVTTLIGIDLNQKGRHLIYSVKISNINKKELYYLSENDISSIKETLLNNLCDSNKKNFQLGHEKIEFIYIGKDGIEMFRIFLSPEICQGYKQ